MFTGDIGCLNTHRHNMGINAKKMSNPKVSVLTPIYNTNAQHLRECIDSVLAQTFTDFEFIILNDSPENTALDEIVASYTDKRIRYYKNDHNMGIATSRNRLMSLARGEYMAILDHDDISMPDRLQSQVEFMDAHPGVGVVSGWLHWFGDQDWMHKTPEYDVDIKIDMTVDSALLHTAAMIRKSVLVDNNIEYEEYFTPAEDYRLWARLMPVTQFHNIQRPLVQYRRHKNNTSVRRIAVISACRRAIALDLRNKFPAYWNEVRHSSTANATLFRLRLFGRIPLLKVKNNRVWLFEIIPIFRIKWR